MLHFFKAFPPQAGLELMTRFDSERPTYVATQASLEDVGHSDMYLEWQVTSKGGFIKS